jgi:hypothetical protein
VAAFSSALAGEDSTPNSAQLRRHLLDSVGNLPWNPTDGYALEGQFILKATGEEIRYRTRSVRSPNRWAVDFSQENRSRDLRYVLSGTQAWVASPEITEDILPEMLPYMARFDFPQLYSELLRILEQKDRDPLYAVNTVANEIHVRGTLPNGWEAVFVFNTIEYFPRKVLIHTTGTTSSAWLLTFVKPDGSCSLNRVPGSSSEFEIWFSDPVYTNGYRYARRMDFAEHGIVVGTFFLEGSASISEWDALFTHPPRFPWAESAVFSPRTDFQRPGLYLDGAELPTFRSRIKNDPWSGWNRTSRTVAIWAAWMLWIDPIFPHTISLKLIALTVAMGLLGFVFLLWRRKKQLGGKFSWGLLLSGVLVSCFVLVAGVSSFQLHQPRNRSLTALHSSISYAASGSRSYAERADALLRNFSREAPARSIEDLGHSCQAYALAYDLIRPDLPIERRTEIETELFEYARPLFGALHGWISNMGGSSVLSAGLGMMGLAIGYEPFITLSRDVIQRTLKSRLVAGLHQSGPGMGSRDMDSAVNLFYALKHADRADYYSHKAFRRYLTATLKMLSPLGTLPLFGNTNLDQPAHLSMFFLKVANHMPEEEGRHCIAAHDLYWAYGQHAAKGIMKWILPVLRPMTAYFENPYVLFQYNRVVTPHEYPPSSAVLGDGRMAILRSGGGPDSTYLALNTRSASPITPHRDILTFDLYAYGSLLLHGPGFPGKENPRYWESIKTAASNSITMNNESQSGTLCTGIESPLLNQPVFDYVRALADQTYDYGRVQRDVVMIRPERNSLSYFLLVDEVTVSNPATTVEWHLHGRGDLTTGINQVYRWTSRRFYPPGWRSRKVSLDAVFLLDAPIKVSSKPGVLYSQTERLNQASQSMILEWTGSGRFCTVLYPYRSAEESPKIEVLCNGAGRVGTSDWISLGGRRAHAAIGPLEHVSEYVIVRDRAELFPALLMISGLEFRFQSHSVSSSKPITASLNGLYGSFQNTRPNTRVEIESPEIGKGDTFDLDGKYVVADKPGRLILLLGKMGEHAFRRTSRHSSPW